MAIRAIIKHNTLSIPLVSGLIEGDKFNLKRYLGGCFFVNSGGVIATCEHVVSQVPDEERLAIIHPSQPDRRLGVTDLKIHPDADIAFGHVSGIGSNSFLSPYNGSENLIGKDVICWGTVVEAYHGNDIELTPRLLKGYVMRHWDRVPNQNIIPALSICELSFSVPEGYSGYPVLYLNNQKRDVQVFGMAYGNLESRVTAYAEETFKDESTTYVEKRERIVEFGLVHTSSDIYRAATDLGVANVFE